MPPYNNPYDPQNPRILLVDDNSCLLNAGSIYLERRVNFRVDTALSGKEALECFKHTSYDAVISDYEMPLMDGPELKRRLRARGIMTPFLFFTIREWSEIPPDICDDPGTYVCKCGVPAVQYSRLAHCVREEINRVHAEAGFRDLEAPAGI